MAVLLIKISFHNILYGIKWFILTVDCRKKLCGFIDGLFHIYHRAVSGESSFKGTAEDSLHLVEALR